MGTCQGMPPKEIEVLLKQSIPQVTAVSIHMHTTPVNVDGVVTDAIYRGRSIVLHIGPVDDSDLIDTLMKTHWPYVSEEPY